MTTVVSLQQSGDSKGIIIILDGSSCAGKSSTALYLRDLVKDPLLHWSVDAYFHLFNKRFFSELFSINPTNGKYEGLAVNDDVRLLIQGYVAAIAAFSRSGVSVIVDAVIHSEEFYQILRETLAGLPVYYFILKAPLPILEKREGRRMIPMGIVKTHYNQVYGSYKIFDHTFDSMRLSAEKIARKITEYIHLHPR